MTNFTLTIITSLFLLFSPPKPNEKIVGLSAPALALNASDLIITEIMYNPSGTDGVWEWIEIYNPGTQPIDLSGFVLDDMAGTALVAANIADGTVPAKGSAVLFDARLTTDQFQDVWGPANLIGVANWPALGNGTGDNIALWDSFSSYTGNHSTGSNAIVRLAYQNAVDGWPDDDGFASIFLTDLNADNTVGSNWALSTVGAVTPLGIAATSEALHGNVGTDIGSPSDTPILEDTTPPVLACGETVLNFATDSGLCSAQLSLEPPSATDNVSTEFTFAAVRNDGLEISAPFATGSTVVAWTATDQAGNTSAPCEQTIIVTDSEAPVAIGQNITVVLDENGEASITPQQLDNTQTPSVDNCGIGTYMASKTEFNWSDVGMPVTVQFSVSDVNGNLSELVDVSLTVIDNQNPDVVCAENVTVESSDGSPVVIADLVAPQIFDNSEGEMVISTTRSDGESLNAPFPLTTTTVIWRVADPSGNVSECLQTVTVFYNPSSENNILSFTLPGQVGESVINQLAKTIQITMPSSTDLNNLVPSIEISEKASIQPETGLAQNFNGPVIYTVSAENGIESIWQVEVTRLPDTTPPTFDVSGNTADFTTELEVGDPYIVGEILNIVDEGATLILITGNELVDTSKPGGPFLVTYQVSDSDNNASTIVETVRVKDPRPIVLAITGFTLVNADTHEDIMVLENGMQIDFRTLPTLHLDIRANATSDVESVHLQLTGTLGTTRTENVAPYAVYGDFPAGRYYGTDFKLGAYTIVATPYAADLMGGTMGTGVTATFELVDPCALVEVVLVDSFGPSSCGGSDGLALVAITGGASPVTYQWSHDPDFQGDILTDLPAGNYTVTAIDAHNCKAEVSFILVDPALPEVSLDPMLPVVASAAPFSLSGGLPLGGVYSGEGVVEGIFDPSIGPGTYDITYTYTDLETECTNTAVQTITVKPDVLRVTGFTLVDADTHEDLFDLVEGMQINVNTLPTLNLDVRANTTNDVESVRISVSGKLTASRTENIVPYALFGDLPAGNYFGNPFSVGAYTVTAEPFAADALKGEKGTSLSINFELVDENLLDNKRSNPLVISPNAASVEATISFKQPVKLVALQVYDLQGRLIKNIPLKGGDTLPNYTLDVQDLAPGSYFVKSQDVHGKVFQKQILINR